MQLRDKDFWLSNKIYDVTIKLPALILCKKKCAEDLQSESSSHFTKFLEINFIQNVKNTFQITLFW